MAQDIYSDNRKQVYDLLKEGGVNGLGSPEEFAATLDDVLRERMVEFAWEGLRRQDLVRFEAFTRSWSSRPAVPGESNGFTTVFPIPADVLDLNPKLSQNPGY